MLIGFQTSSNEKTADFVSHLVPLHWENKPPLMILASDIPTQTQIIRRKVCKSRKTFLTILVKMKRCLAYSWILA